MPGISPLRAGGCKNANVSAVEKAPLVLEAQKLPLARIRYMAIVSLES